MKKKVLFVTYGGGHVNIVKEVYKEMIGDSLLSPEIIALTLASQTLKKADIPHHTISEYLVLFDNREDIIKNGGQLANKEHSSSSGIEYMDSVAYLGFGYIDLSDRYGKEVAKKMYEKDGRKCFLPINTMRTILEFIKPEALIITGSPRMETAAAIAANKKGIPVIQINDYPAEKKIKYDAKVCVMNEWEKKNSAENGLVLEEQMVVTGQPVFENDLKFDEELLKKYISKKKNRKKIDRIILYLGQGKDKVKEADDTINKLWKLSQVNKKYLFIIRPHPNDFYEYPYANTDNFTITKEGLLNYLIYITDVAITHDSTSGIQAALLDKPLISVITKSIERNSLERFGIAVRVDNLEKLEQTIEHCLDCNSAISLKLKNGREMFKNEENAATNIVNVIKQELDCNNSFV